MPAEAKSTYAVRCPHCSNELKAPSRSAGSMVRCRKCGGVFALPVPTGEIVDAPLASAQSPSPASAPIPDRKSEKLSAEEWDKANRPSILKAWDSAIGSAEREAVEADRVQAAEDLVRWQDFRCPRCDSARMPVRRQVGTAAFWVVASLAIATMVLRLFLFSIPFWIALVWIRPRRPVFACSHCGATVGTT